MPKLRIQWWGMLAVLFVGCLPTDIGNPSQPDAFFDVGLTQDSGAVSDVSEDVAPLPDVAVSDASVDVAEDAQTADAGYDVGEDTQDAGDTTATDATADVDPDATVDADPDATVDVDPDATADVDPDAAGDVDLDAVDADADLDTGDEEVRDGGA